jgi:hypothetical protein
MRDEVQQQLRANADFHKTFDIDNKSDFNQSLLSFSRLRYIE